MDGQSLTPQEIKLQELKTIFPEVFTEDKVDWEKLKATLGEDISFSNERYVLNWAGKSDAFKVLQSPTSKTLVPAKDESVNFDETENIFIEGENLEVLKVLQKSYFGKVKMIYIDPPYNTGNDHFIYPDKFSETKDEYEKRVGDKDEEGYMTKDGMFKKNSKENGQYHSNWMNMMYPRLFLAKNLLKQDGIIFISIDDNEVHNLRMIMNEVFGEENLLEQIIWKNKTGGGAKTKGWIGLHEYILCYAKDNSSLGDISVPYSEKTASMYNKKDEHYHIRGAFATWPLDTTSMGDRPNLKYPIIHNGVEIWPKKQWLWSKERALDAQNKNMLVFNQQSDGNYKIRFKGYLKDENGVMRRGKPLSILDGPYTQEGSKDFQKLLSKSIFAFPKPVELIKQLLLISSDDKITHENEIILDFFGGSGTLAQAVMEQNKEDGGSRKYICVQLSEICDEKSDAYKEGFKNIAEISKERIRRAGNNIKQELNAEKGKINSEIPFENNKIEKKLDLGFKVLKLEDSNFKQWQQIKNKDSKALEDQMKLFIDPVAETATIENMVYELLLKSGKDLNSKIINENGYYAINGNELILLLEKAEQKIIDNIIKQKPQKVIALDKLFKDNDQLKTNTVLQMKDAGIEFKTI